MAWLSGAGLAVGLGLVAAGWGHHEPERPRFVAFLSGALLAMFSALALCLSIWG